MTAPHVSDADQRENMVAIGWMTMAMFILPVMDTIAKYLSVRIPPLEITFARFFFQLLICIAAAALTGNLHRLKSRRLGINLLRGSLLTFSSLCFFTALKFMPVATAMAIFFVEPMILTILAVVFLGEKIGVRRVAGILVGLAGAMLILRPSFADAGLAALLPLCTATLFACYLMLNRRFAGQESLYAIQFGTGLAGTIIMGIVMTGTTLAGQTDYAFVMPHVGEMPLLVMIGGISFLGHALVVLAFQKGEASMLAPLNYVEIIGATLLGYLVFGDFPDGMTWMGIGLIVGGGLYIAHRERVKKPVSPKS